MIPKFIHYFLIISSLVFLFTLGPRILVDQLSASNPNTASAQECGQQPCPTVPPTAPPLETPGPTEAPTPAPTQPPSACTPDEVVGTAQHCVGNQMCTFNIHHRADCSTYEGGAYGCQNSTSCGFVNPTTPPATTPPNVCVGTPCDRPVGESTCRSGHQVFCKKDGPECGGVGCNCMVDTGGTCSVGGGSNPTTPPATPTPAPGATTAPTTPPATTPPATTPPTGGNSPSSSSSSSNSSSNASANATAQQQQLQSQSQTTVISNSNSNTNTNNNNQNVSVGGTVLAFATAFPTTTPTPTSTPTPTATPVTTIINGRRVTTIIVGQGGGGAPTKVVGKTQVQGQVQELPNTGLPLISIVLLGLAPVGWKLRKYSLSHLNPSSIWNDRELKK